MAVRLADAVRSRARVSRLATEVTLVDQLDYHQLVTELHEVAAGSIPPDAVALPLSRTLAGKAIRFLQTRVTGFDYAGRRVATEAGELAYDILVIALGSETDFFGIEGLEEHSLTLKSLSDALVIKERVEQSFTQARDEDRAQERRRLLTLVIGGGGFTGTELAGEMADRVRDLGREYGVAPGEARIVVAEAGPSLLSGFDPGLVRTARRILESQGVELLLGAPAVRVTGDTVELKSGESIPYGTLIWTGGVKASELVARSGLTAGVRGRLVVNPYLESVDYSNVFVVGDAALSVNPTTGRPLAPSAQLALQHADCAAQNVLAQLRGTERVPYVPKVVGEVVSVGRINGLAKIGPFAFDGRPAHMLKRGTVLRYLYMLGGLPMVWDWLRVASVF